MRMFPVRILRRLRPETFPGFGLLVDDVAGRLETMG
jgi:hypothetical protein